MAKHGRLTKILIIIVMVVGIATGIFEACKAKGKWDFDPECSAFMGE